MLAGVMKKDIDNKNIDAILDVQYVFSLAKDAS